MAQKKTRKERPFRYSWSYHSLYNNECPKQAKFRYIDKVEPAEKPDKYHAVVGSVLAEVFDKFYNDKIWAHGAEALSTLIEGDNSVLKKAWDKIIGRYHIEWEGHFNRKTPEELYEECVESVKVTLRSIVEHKLLGSYARAEEPLSAYLGDTPLYSRVDLILRREDTGVTILDGKSSVKREKNVKIGQLYFYAFMYEAIYGKLPDRLMFLYYRFGGDRAIDEVKVDPTEIKKLRNEIVDTLEKMARGEYPAKPLEKTCKYCDFEDLCEERQEMLVEKAEKKAEKHNKLMGEMGMDPKKGVQTFSL